MKQSVAGIQQSIKNECCWEQDTDGLLGETTIYQDEMRYCWNKTTD